MKTEPRLAITGTKRSPRMVGNRVVETGSVGSVWMRTGQIHSRRVTDEESSRGFVWNIKLGIMALPRTAGVLRNKDSDGSGRVMSMRFLRMVYIRSIKGNQLDEISYPWMIG